LQQKFNANQSSKQAADNQQIETYRAAENQSSMHAAIMYGLNNYGLIDLVL
jgi:hypothetical protein